MTIITIGCVQFWCSQVPRLSPEQLALKKGPNVRQIDEAEPGMDKEVVDSYLSTLRSAVNSKSEVSEVRGWENMLALEYKTSLLFVNYLPVHSGACGQLKDRGVMSLSCEV